MCNTTKRYRIVVGLVERDCDAENDYALIMLEVFSFQYLPGSKSAKSIFWLKRRSGR